MHMHACTQAHARTLGSDDTPPCPLTHTHTHTPVQALVLPSAEETQLRWPKIAAIYSVVPPTEHLAALVSILPSQVGLCPAASSPLQGKERCGDRQEQLDQPPTHTPLTGRPLSRRLLPRAAGKYEERGTDEGPSLIPPSPGHLLLLLPGQGRGKGGTHLLLLPGQGRIQPATVVHRRRHHQGQVHRRHTLTPPPPRSSKVESATAAVPPALSV